MRPSEAACLRIHFMGYKKTHQRWADPSGADSGHAVMPAHTHTPAPPPVQPRTPKNGALSPPPTSSQAQALAKAAAAADEQAKAAAVPTTTNRFGRAVPKAFAPKAVAAARRAENQEDGDAAAGESGNGASGASGGGKGAAAAASSDDLNDWYCSVCMAFEREDAQDDDVLLSCDGPCLRSFHVNCLGLDAVPEDEVNVKTSSKAISVLLCAYVTHTLYFRMALL